MTEVEKFGQQVAHMLGRARHNMSTEATKSRTVISHTHNHHAYSITNWNRGVFTLCSTYQCIDIEVYPKRAWLDLLRDDLEAVKKNKTLNPKSKSTAQLILTMQIRDCCSLGCYAGCYSTWWRRPGLGRKWQTMKMLVRIGKARDGKNESKFGCWNISLLLCILRTRYEYILIA